MGWNDAALITPPRDRVIEVTSGTAWRYEDVYRSSDARRRPHTTLRQWRLQGGVRLVLWHDAAVLGLDPPREGGWIDTSSDSMMPGFRFWREYENPLAGDDSLLTSTVPPHPLEEEFEGDARLRLYDRIEAEIAKDIAWADGILARYEKEGRVDERIVSMRAEHVAALARTVAARAVAYDPYDMPPGVQGKAA